MALKSSREGLRKELVDYLGNIIIDNNLRQSIINSVNDVFVNETDVLTLEEIQATTDLSGKVASASAVKSMNTYSVGTATNSSYINEGSFSWIKFGRLVIVNINDVKINAVTHSMIELASGLPRPASITATALPALDVIDEIPFKFAIDADGNIVSFYNNRTTYIYFCRLRYCI